MRLPTNFRRRALAVAASLTLMAVGVTAAADPPARVARLGYLSGEVSFSPAGEDEWDRAAINRPLGPGDRLWADTQGRAEIQVGGAMLRLNGSTAVSVLNLDDNITQLQLSEGSLNVRVRRLDQDQSVEVDTPQLAFILREPGAYRIDVDADGNATTVRMREGRGEVSGENASFLLDAPQVQRFTGNAQRDDAYASAPAADDFDRWAIDRDRAAERSVSARYVSPDVVGYEDLDDNGSWSAEASYGNVWYPSRVAVGWTPYRDGHWAWIDPWGWTWVDDAPWGYAVSHYGRWAHIRGRWGWVPGPVRTRAYYAPALVVFVGGPNFRLSISSGGGGGGAGVAWFPLGPREVYRPAYKVSPNYFERVNVSNTVVNTTVVKNVYINKTVTNITYVNQRAPNAVVAVSSNTFTQSQPVAKAVVRAPKEVIESRVVVAAAPIAPTEKSVRGAAAVAGKPPPKAFARAVVARTEPPPPKPSFAAQQQRLTAQPGKPLDDDERKQLRANPTASAATAATPAPAVKVVAKADKPQALPAQAAKAKEAKAGEARVAGAEPSASKPEADRQAANDKADKDRQAANDKADKERQAAADKADKERPVAANKPDRGSPAASAAREAPAAVAERARPAASAARGRTGSEAEALDAVAEAEKRTPAAGRADKPPSADKPNAAAPRADAASAARAARPPGAASTAAGEGRPPAMSREDRQAARAAARGEQGASPAAPAPRPQAKQTPRPPPSEATRPPPAEGSPPTEASRPPQPVAPGEPPPTTARAPHAPAPAASHPKGKKRDDGGEAPS